MQPNFLQPPSQDQAAANANGTSSTSRTAFGMIKFDNNVPVTIQHSKDSGDHLAVKNNWPLTLSS